MLRHGSARAENDAEAPGPAGVENPISEAPAPDDVERGQGTMDIDSGNLAEADQPRPSMGMRVRRLTRDASLAVFALREHARFVERNYRFPYLVDGPCCTAWGCCPWLAALSNSTVRWLSGLIIASWLAFALPIAPCTAARCVSLCLLASSPFAIIIYFLFTVLGADT